MNDEPKNDKPKYSPAVYDFARHVEKVTEEYREAIEAAKLANMKQGERTDLEPSANLPKVTKKKK